MSDFKRFFKENVKQVDTRKKVVISDRFEGDDGNPMPWILKPMKQSILTRMASEYIHDAEFPDRVSYMGELIENTVVEPNLSNKQLQDSYGVMGVVDLLDEMLTPAEYAVLAKEVQKINGGEQDVNELKTEVKN